MSFPSPPPLPQQASQLQTVAPGAGPVRTPPPGLQPYQSNPGVSIAQGLDSFLKNYLGSKQQQQAVYGQKVDQMMDDLASGRRSINSIDQQQVAKWMKLSGRAYRTEEFTPEEQAFQQQQTQQQQLQQQVQQRMQQQGNQQQGPPVQPGQGMESLPPPVQAMLMGRQQQQAPTPQQTGQPQMQPMQQAPPPQQQGGIGGFMQRLLNPAANVSAASPAGDLIRSMGEAGATGAGSPYGVSLRNHVQNLATDALGQKVLAEMGSNTTAINYFSKYGKALLDPNDPDFFEAASVGQRIGTAIPGNMDTFMRLAQSEFKEQGKTPTPDELFDAGFRTQLNLQMMGPFREAAMKHALDSSAMFPQTGVNGALRYAFGDMSGEHPQLDPTKALDYTKAVGELSGLVSPMVPAGVKFWLTDMLSTGDPKLRGLAQSAMDKLKPGSQFEYQLKAMTAQSEGVRAGAAATEASASVDKANTMAYEAVDKAVHGRLEFLNGQLEDEVKRGLTNEAQQTRQAIVSQANIGRQALQLRGQQTMLGLGESGMASHTPEMLQRGMVSHIGASGGTAPMPTTADPTGLSSYIDTLMNSIGGANSKLLGADPDDAKWDATHQKPSN